MDLIQYRVRPVTRYVVTRYHKDAESGGVDTIGEFDNLQTAHSVGFAVCKAEHQRLGWPIDDERMQYPSPAPDHP